MPKPHFEIHRSDRAGWLRAAVLGASDGIVSTASLIVGIAAADAQPQAVVLAGTAALVAGALSMAAGEYVSVCSQGDTERADLAREREELASQPQLELRELAGIYVQRGLDPALAEQVAVQLTAHDALGAHARDELGITPQLSARPLQAAAASAAAFAVGAALPLVTVFVTPREQLIEIVIAGSLACLAVLGGFAARAGGARVVVGAARVVFWSALAMAATALVGHLFGTNVA